MLISNPYSGFNKGNLNQNCGCTQISRSVFEKVFATTPSTSSRLPATLVRFRVFALTHSCCGVRALRTVPAVLYLDTFPVHSTVALTALPAMSFVPLTPLLFNDCRD